MRKERWKPWQPTSHETLPGVVLVPIHGWVKRARAVVTQVLLDEEDLHLVLSCYWQLKRGYARGSLESKEVLMHRVVLGIEDPYTYVDHINHDPLDNRRSNLRLVTPQQNAFNMRSKGGTSAFKGVCYCSRTHSWQAQITVSYRCHFLGRYPSEELAARAYDEAARRLHGEHAHLNFPQAAI